MGLFRGLKIDPRASLLVLAAASLLLDGCVPEDAVNKTSVKSPQATAPALKPSQPAVSAAGPSSAPATPPASHEVQALIDSVESAYQSGVANYHAGKLQTAKADFDRAVDLMLSGNFDLRTQPQLRDEFDRVVDAVNTLEMEALKQGNGFAPKIEPAPVDIANDVTFPVDPNVKAQAIQELKTTQSDLPLLINDPVAGFISYFSSKGRGTLTRSLERAGRYHAMITTVLAEEKVPQDLIYQAVAESGFQPQIVNGRSGAGGMWQFMPYGVYGLTRNGWYDERFDPEKSTHAYARYMKELYAQLGDWYLAMAAYDWGPGNVQKAVERTGYADFWELYRRDVLPKETRNYVPIIMAMTIMTKNPSQYGLTNVEMERPAKYDTVTINYPVDLRLVAQCIGSTQDQLQDLNPSLLRVTTPREGKFDLHLPAGTKEQYETAIAEVPTDMRLWWRYHTVQSGDTLASLARTYHVTAKAITEANHLDNLQLEADARLVIPIAPGKHPQSDNATYARRITRYKVRRGDTVETVAENFGVSPLMLRRWNGLRGDSLSGRKVLALHLPVTPNSHEEVAASRSKTKHSAAAPKSEAADAKPPATKSAQIERLEVARNETRRTEAPAIVHHKVKTGETLYSIANLYNTTVSALKRDNRDVAVLRPGMILVIQTPR